MPAPTPDHPDAALVAWEAELEALVIEWGDLDDVWPKGKTAMERYEIGRRHRDCLARIREIQEAIVATKARTIAGAAVQLRRVEAKFDGPGAWAADVGRIEIVTRGPNGYTNAPTRGSSGKCRMMQVD